MWYGKYGDAETLVRRALAAHRDAPELLSAFAELQEVAAGQRRARADRWREIQTWTDWNWAAVRFPSPAELDRADEFDSQASKLDELAHESMARAALAKHDTAEGSFLEGLLAWDMGKLETAQAKLEEAVRRDPAHLRASLDLSSVYAQLGLRKAHAWQRAAALNLVETTAGPYLRFASGEIARTAWQGSREALAQARRVDPADARVFAYLAIVAEGEQKLDDALAYDRMAIALELARARLRGFGDRAVAGAKLPPAELALYLGVQLRLGQVLLDANRNQEALDRFALLTRLEPRISHWDWATPCVKAALPDFRDDPSWQPEPEPVAALVARAHLGVALALERLGRTVEFQGEVHAAERFKALVPPNAYADIFGEIDGIAEAHLTGKCEFLYPGHLIKTGDPKAPTKPIEAIRLPHAARPGGGSGKRWCPSRKL
jgi:tetratricopeptide (TPR) repeat protein